MLTKVKTLWARLIKNLSTAKPPISVVVVRRYITANGYIGELYVNGRQLGVTCDNLSIAGVRPVLTRSWPYKALTNGLDTIRYGEFTSRVPFGCAYVGSTDMSENREIINRLLDLTKGCSIGFVVLERLWADLGEKR